MSGFNHYNKALKPFARVHRNDSTPAEIRLWCELLRKKQMRGYGFLRQRPVLDYIADFMCKPLMLAIEVDGGYHTTAEMVESDKIRDQRLKDIGFTTLRFTNDEVMRNIENVKRTIEAYIEDFENKRGV
jgi:very-short-patch-repair endonuclease